MIVTYTTPITVTDSLIMPTEPPITSDNAPHPLKVSEYGNVYIFPTYIAKVDFDTLLIQSVNKIQFYAFIFCGFDHFEQNRVVLASVFGQSSSTPPLFATFSTITRVVVILAGFGWNLATILVIGGGGSMVVSGVAVCGGFCVR
ncbi:hypothetical protein Ccrd_002119 [Cynara cardunculus var. scolymus]|uniref:Uncharacterized protein n=1 Tax=Cynara cardunculus var. scolymus TaxID=59895 RepID=A0A103XRY9_CYNCS|nr:hypothetical protein Ccrd_002119 [Cynara cardunculus var. scolymus]